MTTHESDQKGKLSAVDLHLLILETESRLGTFGDGHPRTELDRYLVRRCLRSTVGVEVVDDIQPPVES